MTILTYISYRAIYELAIGQWDLDMPEVLWKAYIDFEVNEGDIENARRLYSRLLDKSSHVKVWIAYAQFESENIGAESAREAFLKG